MKRRKLLLAMAAVVVPLRLVTAQAPAVRRVAVLDFDDAATRANQWQVFRQRLRELGYAEGGNLAIELRWAGGVAGRLPRLVDELLAARPEVIVATYTPVIRAVMKATSTVPIVMTGQADPVGTGLVASLARPGGNVTGVAGVLEDLAVKRLEILREIVRPATRFALLGPASNDAVTVVFRRLQTAARSVGVAVRLLDAGDSATIRRAFEGLAEQPVDGLLVASALRAQVPQIVELAYRYRVPACYSAREFAEAGGLVAYGSDSTAMMRRVAEYVDRILQGASPATLPVDQVRGYELVVNMRTAKALGLAIPQALLLRADEVIQ